MIGGKRRTAFVRPTILLALLVGLSLAIRQGIAERSRPKLPPHSPIADVVAKTRRRIRIALDRANVTPTPDADDLLVARRISLALVGSVPSLQEIRWLEDQPSDERLQRWTDRLLDDPRCHSYLAERFARAMNSLAPAEPFFMYRRRRFVAWLSDRIAHRVPYDEIVRDCIADDGVWTEKPSVNFLTGHDIDPNKLANRTARAFLGLRIDCAECHDHPFASWKQSDFRGLAAWYGNAALTWRGVVDQPGPAMVEHPVSKKRKRSNRRRRSSRNCFRPTALPASGSQHGRRTRRTSSSPRRSSTASGNSSTAKESSIRSTTSTAKRCAPAVLDGLAADFVEHGYDLQRLIRVMVSLKAFRRQSAFEHDASEQQEAVFAAFPISRLRPEQAAGSLVQVSRLFTIDDRTSTLMQLVAFGSQNDFIERYGDAGEEETTPHDGNIAQRLLMLNGEVVHKEIKSDLATTARHLASLTPNDESAVDLAFRLTLARLPRSRRTNETGRVHSNGRKSRRGFRRPDVVAGQQHGVLMESVTLSTTRRRFCLAAAASPFGLAVGRTHRRRRRQAARRQSEVVDPPLARRRSEPIGDVRSASRHGNRRADAGDSNQGSWIGVRSHTSQTRSGSPIALRGSVVDFQGRRSRPSAILHEDRLSSDCPPSSIPALGAVCGKELSGEGLKLPPYISLLGKDERAGGGYLGDDYDPFVVLDVTKPVPDLSSPVGKGRRDRRFAALDVIEKSFSKDHPKLAERTNHDGRIRQALELMDSPQVAAFDLTKEPESVRRLYGESPFGKACLAARRLVEAGVPCVEVQLRGWDSHANNFNVHDRLCADLDPGISGLIADLRFARHAGFDARRLPRRIRADAERSTASPGATTGTQGSPRCWREEEPVRGRFTGKRAQTVPRTWKTRSPFPTSWRRS